MLTLPSIIFHPKRITFHHYLVRFMTLLNILLTFFLAKEFLSDRSGVIVDAQDQSGCGIY